MNSPGSDWPVRKTLLLEISALRESCAQLLPASAPGCSNSSCADEEGGHLGQSDRDAIEAFFNASEDDFTRLFNDGVGSIQRADLLGKIP